MSVIVYRNGVLAADTRMTVETEAGGSVLHKCDKLYALDKSQLGRVIVGLAGGSFDGLAFLDWLRGSDEKPPERLIDGDADFSALVLTENNKLYEFDKWCRKDAIKAKFYAIGSGAKAALGALHMGASAYMAVKVACKIDPYCAVPVKAMRIAEIAQPRPRAVRRVRSTPAPEQKSSGQAEPARLKTEAD